MIAQKIIYKTCVRNTFLRLAALLRVNSPLVKESGTL
jgi:hypothetical protein